MKSRIKVIFITLGVTFLLFSLVNFNLNYHLDNRDEYTGNSEIRLENLISSRSSVRIRIIDNSGWIAFRNAGNCTGSGTFTDPYYIEDLIIDGGGLGSCIIIENSNVYFKIENCTIYNSGSEWYTKDAGINLFGVNNGMVIRNNCSYNRKGINLENSNNNTIKENNVNNNDYGIHLANSNKNKIIGNVVNIGIAGIHIFGSNNNVSGNRVNYKEEGIRLVSAENNVILDNILNSCLSGMSLSHSLNNTFRKNIMSECGFGHFFGPGTSEELSSNNIDSTNLVNGKPLYYYKNEINLESNDFLNAGQIILVNCNNSMVSSQNLSFCSLGLSLYYCTNNTISGIIAKNNRGSGIYLHYSHSNTFLGNTLNNNQYGIKLYYSNQNNISGSILNNNNIYGIELRYCHGNFISDNELDGCGVGIDLWSSDRNKILKNIIYADYCGISFGYNCNHNDIVENTINNSTEGIYLSYGDDNLFSQNKLINNKNFGIELGSATNSIIIDNIINNSQYGMFIYYNLNNTFRRNIMNECGLGRLYGSRNELSSNNIDTTNLVNGRPLYYYKNEINLGLNDFVNAGQIILVNCNNSTILSQILSFCSLGLSLYYCNNNTISGIIANNNAGPGIYLHYSHSNTFLGNIVNKNQYGIQLYFSNYNSISGNIVNNNSCSIFLDHSNYNYIYENIIFGNTECVKELDCIGNIFKDNQFCNYGEDNEDNETVPGYNMMFLYCILFIVSILIFKKVKNQKKFLETGLE
ncbi:MAG: NosD domain-containing protein [Candidatus Thorarchaeota archaeon]